MIGFLDCKCTLPAHVQPLIHRQPQVPPDRAALNLFIPQPLLAPEVSPTQCTFSKFVNDTDLGGMAGTPEGYAAIRKDLNGLRHGLAGASLMKINKEER
ncbi:hypothetical protein WISP_63141 [Willisornis vidua]|uniref:Uncharacterized protein n=1 Tax=Willisornis vidua TaxID=1566151 RepID=A0ABQ9DG19_9PASS|nr:hypothetical protein WISP_63141 [Willisornis vidua]